MFSHSSSSHDSFLRRHKWLVAVLVTAALATLGSVQAVMFSSHFRTSSVSTSVKPETQTVIVHVDPSRGDVAVVQAARLSWNRVDTQALHEDRDKKVFTAHRGLGHTLDAFSQDGVELVLTDVPTEVHEQYEAGEISVTELVSSASSVHEQDPSSQAEEETKILNISPLDMRVDEPTVKEAVGQVFLDRKEVEEGVQGLEEALRELPVQKQLEVLGTANVDLREASDKELAEAVRSHPTQAVQEERDNRLIETLPDFSKQKNGHVDEDLLCTIPWSTNYRIACAGLPRLEELMDAFEEEFGYVPNIISAYRSYEEQEIAHSASPTMTTLPGTSNHSWGLAIDFDWDIFTSYDDPEVVWMVENGPIYGWRNPNLESLGTTAKEPWHYEFGTKYTDEPGWGFNGPEPAVPFEIEKPTGWKTQTLQTVGAG